MLELNKIYNIDCLDGLKKIDDKSIDLIFTDPPYNIKYKNQGWDFRDDYLGFMEKVFVECDRVLKDTGSFYFFHNQYYTIHVLQDIIDNNTSFYCKNFITWHKKNLLIKNWGYPSRNKKTCLNKFFQTCEYILYYTKSNLDTRTIVHRDKNKFREIRDYLKEEKIKSKLKYKEMYHILKSHTFKHYFSDYNFIFPSEKDYKKLQVVTGCFKKEYEELKQEYLRQKEEYYKEIGVTFNKFDLEMENFIETTIKNSNRIHPCQKPREVIERYIRISTNTGNIVLDLFSGSGMIPKVAKELKRKYIGFELNKEYYKKSLDFIDDR